MTTKQESGFKQFRVEEYTIREEPFYIPLSDEVELFEAAYREKLPVLMKGPTGVGKTRFVEYMAYRLSRPLTVIKGGKKEKEKENGNIPLVTIACHEDLTASDLVGRYLLEGDETRWIDGPLTRAVKHGAICYLDEIVEARKDTTVLIHPLTDHRRVLPVEKLGVIMEAHENFLMAISYNPGDQSALKDLKQSTRQRFIAVEFTNPRKEEEAKIIEHESGVDEETAWFLAKLGEKVRHLTEHGLQEGVSTRLLIYAAKLIKQNIPARRACQVAITWALTDDHQLQQTVDEVISALFE